MWKLMGSADKLYGVPCDPACSCKKKEGDYDRSKGFSFAVSIRMVIVWRLHGNSKTDPKESRAEDISGSLGSVGDQRIGMPNVPGNKLDKNQDYADCNTECSSAHPLSGRMNIDSMHLPSPLILELKYSCSRI
jgi:hypothetical protein